MNHTSFATSLGVSQAEAALVAYDSRTADGLKSIQKTRYSHEAMADAIIAEPTITHNRLAEIFGRTAPWISIVVNSDAFKAYLAKRKGEILDPLLTATVKDRFEAVVAKSTEVLLAKLNQPIEKISDGLALKAVEIGAKALGVGGNAAPAPPSDHLSHLAERLLALQSNVRSKVYDEIQDVEAREVVGAAAPHPGQPNPPAVPDGPAEG